MQVHKITLLSLVELITEAPFEFLFERFGSDSGGLRGCSSDLWFTTPIVGL